MRKSPRSESRTILLAERIEHLSTKRQEIIRPILEQPREYVLLSVRALAERLHTDPATMVRIVHGLGFENYKQFQRHLHELSLAFATSLDTMRQGESDRGTGSPAGDSVLSDLKNLQGFKNTLDAKRYKQLAKRIHEARRVVILACDLATVLADYLGYQLSLLGLPVHVATSPGAIAHTVLLLTKQDLVIAISFRRGLRSTIEGVHQARERGAYCVGITDTYISPLAQKCHEAFLASINSVSFGASYTAPIALSNVILTAVGEFHRSRTMEIVRELAEEQQRGSRWYTN